MTEALDYYIAKFLNEEAEAAAQMPKCAICEEPIWDEYHYHINSKDICRTCMDDRYMVHNEAYE